MLPKADVVFPSVLFCQKSCADSIFNPKLWLCVRMEAEKSHLMNQNSTKQLQRMWQTAGIVKNESLLETNWWIYHKLTQFYA